MFKFQYQNEKKRKSGKRFSGLQNRAIRELQYGQLQRFQIGAKRSQIGAGISN